MTDPTPQTIFKKTVPVERQAKFLSLLSRTAFGLVMSKKSTDCGWNLAKVATGNEADST